MKFYIGVFVENLFEDFMKFYIGVFVENLSEDFHEILYWSICQKFV